MFPFLKDIEFEIMKSYRLMNLEVHPNPGITAKKIHHEPFQSSAAFTQQEMCGALGILVWHKVVKESITKITFSF